MTRRSDTRALLDLLHAGNAWASLWTDAAEDPDAHGTSLWYQVLSGPPAPPESWENVYFGVHGYHSRGTERQRAGRGGHRLGYANCLYADFDAKQVHYGSVDAILAHLDGLPLYPTAIIATGGGVHAYWLLDAPVDLRRPSHRARLEQVQGVWVESIVGADPGAKDLSRVLRLPGSWNFKYDPARPVDLLEFGPARVYSHAAIREAVWPYVELREEQARVKAERAREQAGDASWAELVRAAERLRYRGARHNWALWLAHKLSEASCPELIADELVADFIDRCITDRPTTGEARGIMRHAYK